MWKEENMDTTEYLQPYYARGGEDGRLLSRYLRPTVDAMDDETFELYLRYHFSICERADLVGATHHSLDIFRKES